MEWLKSEKYGTIDRDFEIHTYRDNNGDRLIIEPVEITNGQRVDLLQLRAYVPMNGEFNKPQEEYENYSDSLAGVKSSLIIYVHAENP